MNLLSSDLPTASTARVPLLDDVPLPSEVGPGWIALVLMLTLMVVTVLLWMSMRKQLRKIDFEEEPNGDAAAPGTAGPDDPEHPGRP